MMAPRIVPLLSNLPPFWTGIFLRLSSLLFLNSSLLSRISSSLTLVADAYWRYVPSISLWQSTMRFGIFWITWKTSSGSWTAMISFSFSLNMPSATRNSTFWPSLQKKKGGWLGPWLARYPPQHPLTRTSNPTHAAHSTYSLMNKQNMTQNTASNHDLPQWAICWWTRWGTNGLLPKNR